MEREHSAAGVVIDDGPRPVYREIFWQEMCLLGYVVISRIVFRQKTEIVVIYEIYIIYSRKVLTSVIPSIGWTKFMEWKYPVEVVMTNKAEFRMAGAVAAAASL